MKRSLTLSLATFCLAIVMIIGGCQYTKDNPKTTTGAATGAAAGGLIGAMTKGTTGAVVGAVLGGLAGGAIGQHMDKKDRDAESTREAYDYDPAQGQKLQPIAMTVEPQSVRPGQTISITTRYAVLAPEDSEQITVKEQSIVTHNGSKVAETTIEVQRTPGTYSSTIPIRLPDSAAIGSYNVQLTLDSPAGTANQSATFTVRR